MKTLKNPCLALVAVSLLAIPAAAQRGRADSGAGKQRGQDRAEQVQNENKKGDKDRSKAGRSHGKHEGWEKKGKHKAKVHS
jgi:hypothetical protein